MKFIFQKKTMVCLLALYCGIVINSTADAQSWQSVGAAGFSPGVAGFATIAINSTGVPYIAYSDSVNGSKATVMKYTGGSWVDVGSADFTTAGILNTDIAIGLADTPYIAFQDNFSNGEKTTVMKFDGTNWVLVGSEAFSAGQAMEISLAINRTGTPYVAYVDFGNGNRATVMKYDGAAWVNVGVAGFSAGTVGETSLAIDTAGTPYVFYSDGANAYKATVMKYDGSNWVTVGSAGFSANLAFPFISSIAINYAGIPYVVYSDYDTLGNPGPATVKKYNGSDWETVGSTGFSAGVVEFPAIAIDSSGTLFVTYADRANGDKATVMKYNGSAWENVGSAGFSTGAILYNGASKAPPSIAINRTGTPYIVFADSSIDSKATVMRYANSTMVQEPVVSNQLKADVFPDPITSFVTITYTTSASAATFVHIIDVTGRVIMARQLGITPSGTVTLPASQLASGLYIVQVTCGPETVRRKMVKQ